jgi:hypothetical protein
MGLGKYLSGHDIRAQIILERHKHKGGFLIVEGPSDDKALYRFLDGQNCSIVIAHGKRNALEAIDLLEDDGADFACCVVDADFDRVMKTAKDGPNVVVTDHHDMDLTIFLTKALNSYLAEYGDREKIEAAERKLGAKTPQLVLEAAEPLGRLRYLNELRALGLNFRNLPYERFISSLDVSCDSAVMLRAVFDHSAKPACDLPKLDRIFRASEGHNYPLPDLCNGHDVAAILGIALRALLGSRRDTHTWASEIEAGLRLCFTEDTFKSTQMRSRLADWDQRNVAYHVLPR